LPAERVAYWSGRDVDRQLGALSPEFDRLSWERQITPTGAIVALE
jgi:hypothetical protein